VEQKPNFELLKDAYAIISGIPDDNFRLSTWFWLNNGKSCGTIACAGGWLALHPDMQERGLGVNPRTDFPTFDGDEGYSALGKFFGVGDDDATRLFSGRHTYDRGLVRPRVYMSDKKLFLARVRKYLSNHGQLKEQLEAAGAA
jgi:hypothetical protein